MDIDLINNIMREPYADRFRLILNDLGAGFAARGKDLGAIIKRADPALQQTNRVLAELASQNQSSASSPATATRSWLRGPRAPAICRVHQQREHRRRGDRGAKHGPRGRLPDASRRRSTSFA